MYTKINTDRTSKQQNNNVIKVSACVLQTRNYKMDQIRQNKTIANRKPHSGERRP